MYMNSLNGGPGGGERSDAAGQMGGSLASLPGMTGQNAGQQNLQQANVMVRQIQMLQQQRAQQLRDLQTLAGLPPDIQAVAAQRLGLSPQMLTPAMLQSQMQQLQQVIQQYQVRLMQVQMQQNRLQSQMQMQPPVQQMQQMQQMRQNNAQAAADRFGATMSGAGMRPSLANGPAYASQQSAAGTSGFAAGDRFRNLNNQRRKKRDASPEPVHYDLGDEVVPTRNSARASARKKVNYAEAEALAGITDDSDEEHDSEDERQKKKQKTAIAAFDDTSDLDDEVERILAHRDMEGVEHDPTDPWSTRELFVKWRRWSHIHCSWDTRETLSQLAGYKRVQNYIKRMDMLDHKRKVISREEIELLDVERQMEYQLAMQHQEVERIIAERVEQGGAVRKYLCKWKGLPYCENTWETVEDIIRPPCSAQEHIDEYLNREQRVLLPPSSVEMSRRMFLQKHRGLLEQPAFLKGGQLRDYQLASLNWMIYSWLQNNNVILADEMGLGKTVQCASLVGYFSEVLNIYGPFLVVVPLSTVPNWIKEMRKWIPNVNAVVYVGDTKSREVIREFEFYSKRRSDREFKFEVLITTYELVLKDADILSNIRWNFLIVDEAHRLKNSESALYRELIQWPFKNKLLVTGTPLQNSVKELWALLHFLEPLKFATIEEFEMRYNLNDAVSVQSLHAALKPHLLRRVIKDVEKSLPPKNERILRVAMTPLQRQYYKWVLSRNFKELNKGSKGQVTLLNIISDLKKCCNHPFLFESAEEEYKGHDETSMIDRLVRTSGKMVLLDKLLMRLKSSGHRVLLFSQMVRMLDIISDYMRLKGWQHQRLDGSTPPIARHQAMEHFNADTSTDFAFLLSTRAGGLGINLATADTVIIFDSDWNPQNDLQAMSRAHRIGQKNHVNIYRFVTMDTVEEDILERAKKKMVLDHVVIQRMDTSGRTVLDPASGGKMFDKGELAAILRFGAEDLFKQLDRDDEEVKERDNKLYGEDIDAILARAELVDNRVQEEADDKKNELLSAFNVATFKNEEDDATFWNRLITDQGGLRPDGEGGDGDDVLMPRTARLKNATSERGKGGRRKSNRDGRDGNAEAAETPPGILLTISEWPPDCDVNGNPAPCSNPNWFRPEALSRRDAHIFFRGMRRYARIEKLDTICEDVGSVLEDAPPEARYALWWGIQRTCMDAVAAANAQDVDPKDAQVNFFGNLIRAQELLQHIEAMRLLAMQISQLSDPYTAFRLDADSQCPPPKWAHTNNWTVQDDSMLLLGSYLYGICHWDAMVADERLGLSVKLSGAVKDGRKFGDKHWPQASHVETRVMALLKKIERQHNPGPAPRPGRKSKKGKDAPQSGAASRGAPRRRRPANNNQEACAATLDSVMAELKKLRLLSKGGEDIPQARVIAKTRKYLMAIGDKISGLPDNVSGLPSHEDLWNFVSEFTQNEWSGDKLQQVYFKQRGGGMLGGQEDVPDDEDRARAGASDGAQFDASAYAEEEEEEEFGAGGSAEDAEGGEEQEYDDDYDPDD